MVLGHMLARTMPASFLVSLLAIGVIGNVSDSDSEVPGSSPGSPATRVGSSKVREQAVTAMRVKASANNP